MKAKLIIDTRQIISENTFVELRVWEVPYTFVSPEQLLTDFWNDVDNWRS